MESRFHFIVPPQTAPSRADTFCTNQIKNMTRAKLKNGLIRLEINGKPAKLSRTLTGGDEITLLWNNPVPETLEPEDVPLNILFENEDVIAVNKKAGIVTHPAAGNWTGTLVQALYFYRLYRSPVADPFIQQIAEEAAADKKNFTERLRTGIVHRLDKDTSGVIITARNPQTECFLKQIFKERKADKYYVALLAGIPKHTSGTITTAIYRDTRRKICFCSSPDLSKGKYARSRYKVLRVYDRYALVLFKIYTGRTHQIRLHAKNLGCPVLGDSLYGNRGSSKPAGYEKKYGLMLHAYKIRIPLNPHAADKTLIKAPLPSRFVRVLHLLRQNTHEVSSH